jgi:hypothetical protein
MSKNHNPQLTRKLAEAMHETSLEHGESLSMSEAVRVADKFCSRACTFGDDPAPEFTPYQIAAARAAANFRSMADYVLNAFECDDPRPDKESWEEAKRFILEVNPENLMSDSVILEKHGAYKLHVTLGEPDFHAGDEMFVAAVNADAAYDAAVGLVKLSRSGGAVELFRNGHSLRRYTAGDDAVIG